MLIDQDGALLAGRCDGPNIRDAALPTGSRSWAVAPVCPLHYTHGLYGCMFRRVQMTCLPQEGGLLECSAGHFYCVHSGTPKQQSRGQKYVEAKLAALERTRALADRDALLAMHTTWSAAFHSMLFAKDGRWCP
eukprot:776904-Amphidinium_carterae.1